MCPYPAAAPLIGGLLLLFGCSTPPDAPGAPARLPLPLTTERFPAANKPDIRLPVAIVTGEVSTQQAVVLDREYALEFIPYIRRSAGPGDARASVWMESGGVESHLYSVAARRWPPAPRERVDWRRRADSVLDPARVDLSAHRGQEVRFRWKLELDGEPAAGLLGRPRLRPLWPAAGRRADVLLVCSDTHRVDFSLEGHGPELMPSLRRLARQGVSYTHAYSTASWTLPSVVSTLTGLHPRYHRSGRLAATVDAGEFEPDRVPRGHFAFGTGEEYRLLTAYPRSLRSMPEYLADAGYTSVFVAANPLYFLSGLAGDGTDLALYTGVATASNVIPTATRLLWRIPTDEPLFLLVHFMDVHEWQERKLSPSRRDKADSATPDEVRAAYASAVSSFDRQLGLLLDVWAETRGDDSLIIFFSDHGEHLQEPPREELLGHGNSMDEVLLRVPLVIRYPAASDSAPAGGSIATGATSLIDILPTVLSTVGLPVDEGLPGLALDRGGPVPADRTLFADFQLLGRERSSVRRGPHKLVLDLEASVTELFDSRHGALPAAPSTAVEKKRRELIAAFLEYRAAAKEWSTGIVSDTVTDSEEVLESLRALGYVD